MIINVLILAGGLGSRFDSKLPKQFLTIKNEPIIVRTIKNFEKNKRINEIFVVCSKNYRTLLKKQIKKFDIKKVKLIIDGGKTNYESTKNGIFAIENMRIECDYLIIHDAVRPILPQTILDGMIDTALKKGNASLAIPCYETVLKTNDGESGIKEIDRDTIMRIQTPQMYKYKEINKLYKLSCKENKTDFIYANSLAIYYGMKIYFSRGFLANIKITTKDDIPECEYYLSLKEKELIK